MGCRAKYEEEITIIANPEEIVEDIIEKIIGLFK